MRGKTSARFARLGWAVTLILMVAGPSALAGDGQLEINQTCAAGPGCFAGDAPGFPVTITARGSYIMTSNMFLSAAGTNMIEITAVGATLDLNGFELKGDLPSMVGILIGGAGGASGWRTVVKNGQVSVFGDAIRLENGRYVRLINLTVGDIIATNGAAIRVNNGGGVLIDTCTIDTAPDSATPGPAYGLYLNNTSASLNAHTTVLNSVFDTNQHHIRVETANAAGTTDLYLGNSTLTSKGGATTVTFAGPGSGNLIQLGANVCGTNNVCP